MALGRELGLPLAPTIGMDVNAKFKGMAGSLGASFSSGDGPPPPVGITSYTQLENLMIQETETYARFEAYLIANTLNYAYFEAGNITEGDLITWWNANP